MSISVKSMNISIKHIAPALPDEWDSIWKGCLYSTYFHSREWAEIWNAYTKGKMRPRPKVVEFSDGKRALLPCLTQKHCKGLVTSYISSPAGTFGGWISTDALTPAHAKLLANYLTKKLDNLVLRLNPYDKLVLKAGIKPTRDDETHALDLLGGFDLVYKGWKRNHTYGLRKAREGGVEVRVASTQEDWSAYYEVYEDSLQRWGDQASSRYAWEIFEEMLRRNSPYIKLWLATYQDKIISGVLCLYSNKHVDAWHAATLAEHFKLRPETLVMYEAIKDACERGYSWFDFNPSGGHEGVRTFKERFGAQAFSCPEVIIKAPSSILLSRVSSILKGKFLA
ncbi:MAG: lipid II:glycine glycyltransferase FemX [Candidatus Aquicultor sp.]